MAGKVAREELDSFVYGHVGGGIDGVQGCGGGVHDLYLVVGDAYECGHGAS
jgi:hypothetical protein